MGGERGGEEDKATKIQLRSTRTERAGIDAVTTAKREESEE